MGFTYKFILDVRRKSSSGKYPLKLRIYRSGNYKELSLGIKLREDEWNNSTQSIKKSANDKSNNAKLQLLKGKLELRILLCEQNEPQSLDQFAAEFRGNEHEAKKATVDIVEFTKHLIEAMKKTGRIGNSIVYSCALNKLISFADSKSIQFEWLTSKKLNEFRDAMMIEGIKLNTISVYLRTIRAIYNRAIGDGLIESKLYPFGGIKIKSEETISRTLTLSELQKISTLDLKEGSPIWHQRNLFLLSFCFIGINFADMLTLATDNIINDRLVFRRRKTGKVYSIRIHSQAKTILNNYQQESTNNRLLLPVIKSTNNPVKLNRDIYQARKTCNKYLRKMASICSIEKAITTYYARYSWANIAKSLGYSKDLIAEALGHEYGNKVTGIYLDSYSNDTIDEANRRVIESVFK